MIIQGFLLCYGTKVQGSTTTGLELQGNRLAGTFYCFLFTSNFRTCIQRGVIILYGDHPF